MSNRAQLFQEVVQGLNLLIADEDFQHSIDQALICLGEATEVDRVYIFENHPHDPTGVPAVTQRFKWSRLSVESQLDNPMLRNLSYKDTGLLWWYNTLRVKEVIKGIVHDMPEAERSVLEPQGIQSILVIPIFIRDLFWGFIGFDDCHTDRQWTSEEQGLLSLAAASIGGVVARKQSEDALVRLVQQSKQAAIGQMIGSIAHQWRQPLNGISLAAGEILFDIELGEVTGNVGQIQTNCLMVTQLAKEISGTITDFMEFFSVDVSPTSFNVLQAIEKVAEIVQPQLYKHNIRLKYHIDQQLTLHTKHHTFQQVVMNLLNESFLKVQNLTKTVIAIHAIPLGDHQGIELNLQYEYAVDMPIEIPEDLEITNRITNMIIEQELNGTLHRKECNNSNVRGRYLCDIAVVIKNCK